MTDMLKGYLVIASDWETGFAPEPPDMPSGATQGAWVVVGVRAGHQASNNPHYPDILYFHWFFDRDLDVHVPIAMKGHPISSMELFAGYTPMEPTVRPVRLGKTPNRGHWVLSSIEVVDANLHLASSFALSEWRWCSHEDDLQEALS